MNEIHVSSWNELNDALFANSWSESLGRFRANDAFRGLADAADDVWTGLSRLGAPGTDLERHIIRNFRKYAHDAVSTDTIWNWLAVAQHHGLPTRLLETHPRPGTPAKLTPAAWAGLEAEMRAGRIATLRDAQRYLQEQWAIPYSLNGIWYHLCQRRARLKTGRRWHQRVDSAQQAASKSRLRRTRAGPRSEPGLGDG